MDEIYCLKCSYSSFFYNGHANSVACKLLQEPTPGGLIKAVDSEYIFTKMQPPDCPRRDKNFKE